MMMMMMMGFRAELPDKHVSGTTLCELAPHPVLPNFTFFEQLEWTVIIIFAIMIVYYMIICIFVSIVIVL